VFENEYEKMKREKMEQKKKEEELKSEGGLKLKTEDNVAEPPKLVQILGMGKKEKKSLEKATKEEEAPETELKKEKFELLLIHDY
jgi:hypothetical protein